MDLSIIPADRIKDFMQYEYLETKDLLKTFITLISATLVLSLTFSEKIIKFDVANKLSKFFVILAWSFFVFSLVTAGISMCFIAAAAGKIKYGGIPLINWPFWKFALFSWICILISGSAYVAGLISLILSITKTVEAEKPDKLSAKD